MRDGTAKAHARLDRTISELELAHRTDYGTFLTIHARVIPAVETRLEHGGIAIWLPDWHRRRRTAALMADIRCMGLPSAAADVIAFSDGVASDVGAMYVLEGSRIGGRFLAGRLPTGGAAMPRAYLDHGRGQDLWPRFVSFLNRQTFTATDEAQAVRTANIIFDAFQTAAAAEMRTRSAGT